VPNHTTLGPLGSIRGYSLVEILVAIGIFGIVARIAIPHFDARRLRVTAAQQLVAANLRLARAKAITKSVHYRVDFPTATQMAIKPMVRSPGEGTWAPDTSNSQAITLPGNTRFASGEHCTRPCTPVIGTSIEFNSRGVAVNLAAMAQITLIDDFGKSKALEAWPSGQIDEL
jgi:prepilin-type N-terminal cleavage/methylation domain-containing protein